MTPAMESLFESTMEIDWATDAVGRWDQYQKWQSCRDLTEEQINWVQSYPKTEEYARMLAFYQEFEHPVAAGYSV